VVSSGQVIQADKLKDYLNRETATKSGIPIDTVEEIVSFAFKDAKEKMKHHNELVLIGWGTFMVCIPKIKKRLNMYYRLIEKMTPALSMDISDERRELTEKKLATIRKRVAILEGRLKKFSENED